MSDSARRLGEVQVRLAGLRRMQKELLAQMQKVQTICEAMRPDADWEDRYIAEGVRELEAQANGDAP